MSIIRQLPDVGPLQNHQAQVHLPAEVTEGQAVQLLIAELEVLRHFVLVNLMFASVTCACEVPGIR